MNYSVNSVSPNFGMAIKIDSNAHPVIKKQVAKMAGEKAEKFWETLDAAVYRQKDNPISYRFIDDSTIEIISNIPLKSVTPGQAGVLYDFEGRLLGGGIIEEIYYKGKRKITTHLESNI